jgi:uncharacterized membrane-anchored protein
MIPSNLLARCGNRVIRVMELAMTYRLTSVLLRNGAILCSFGISVAAGIYLARTLPMSIWMGIVIVHLTCAIALVLLLLTERVASWLPEYLRRHGQKPNPVHQGFGIPKSPA